MFFNVESHFTFTLVCLFFLYVRFISSNQLIIAIYQISLLILNKQIILYLNHIIFIFPKTLIKILNINFFRIFNLLDYLINITS